MNNTKIAKIATQRLRPRSFAKLDVEYQTPRMRSVNMNDTNIATGQDDDAALFMRFRDHGDSDAFEILFKRHRDSVLAYLWTLTGNRAVAEDVSQYCWLRLMESDSDSGYRPRPGATIVTYLRTVGRNRYIDEYKRKHAETKTESVDESDHRLGKANSAYDDALREQTRHSIETALTKLPMEQRDILAMWLQGFSINEMMQLTAAPRDTVISRKKYAIKKLKTAFELAGVRLADVPV